MNTKADITMAELKRRRRAGVLECEKCGSRLDIEFHEPFPDDRPWIIEPLCRFHHRGWHAEQRAIRKRMDEIGLLRVIRECLQRESNAVEVEMP